MGKQAVVAVGLCLSLAGCGSGQREAPPPTKSAFRAQADGICAGAKTRSGRVAGLRALRPPAGDDQLYSRWLKAEADALAATTFLTDPSKKTDVDPAVALAIAEGKVTGYARRMGAETCATRTIGTMPP